MIKVQRLHKILIILYSLIFIDNYKDFVDYRNEWGVPVINLGLEDVWIEDGERICQAVLKKFERIEWEEVDELNETDRKGGFGHTGLK